MFDAEEYKTQDSEDRINEVRKTED